MDMDANGDWREVQSGEPWDWKESLSRAQLFEIAEAACRIADRRQKPIEVMFFTGVTLPGGSVCCLPWFCTDKFKSSIGQSTGIRFSGRRITVRNRDDVQWIRDQWQSDELRKPFSIRLRPEPDLLRSAELLTEIAQVAKTADVAVELEGSVLSHCYYILRSNSVKVCCVDVLDQRLPKRRFGKLVRDKIPLRIEAHGERPLYLRVTPGDLIRLLKAKAVEESLELFWEDGTAQTISELTDLLEVIDSAARLCGKSLDDLLQAAEVKRDERGGFRDGLVLLETRAVPLIARERHGRRLFEDEEIFGDTEQVGAADASKKEWDLGDAREPRSEGSGLLISLVPPDWARNRKQVVLPVLDGTHEAIISYTHCDVRVVFQRRDRYAEDPRQLKLSYPV
jgi:predicted house-cleaning noncanonical NTP pyrophosphatase (MazG superfamily)